MSISNLSLLIDISVQNSYSISRVDKLIRKVSVIKITTGLYNVPCVVNYVLVSFQVLVTSGLCCIRDISPGYQTCLRFRSVFNML